MKIKPSKLLIYVYYDCSKCGNRYEELRLSELKYTKTLVCDCCDNRDSIEPPDFLGAAPQKEKVKAYKNDKVKSKLVFLGYGSKEVEKTISNILEKNPNTSDDTLFKLVVTELSNVS